jgi:hypothetical protein
MDPHYYRVGTAALGLSVGAIIAVIPGLFVRQIWPERRELPKNYGGVLYHDLAGNFIAIDPIIRRRTSSPPKLRRVFRPRTPSATIGGSALRLDRS